MLLTFLLTSNPVTNHHSFFYKIFQKEIEMSWLSMYTYIFFGFPLQSMAKRGNECLPTTFVGHNSVACPILELISIFLLLFIYAPDTRALFCLVSSYLGGDLLFFSSSRLPSNLFLAALFRSWWFYCSNSIFYIHVWDTKPRNKCMHIMIML